MVCSMVVAILVGVAIFDQEEPSQVSMIYYLLHALQINDTTRSLWLWLAEASRRILGQKS